MKASDLWVFTARFNPLRWEAPDRHFRDWCQHMLDSGVQLVVAELQYGEREFSCQLPGIKHVALRAESWAWSKENLLNLAIQRFPEAKYICWSDSDVFHRRPHWAVEAVEALQHYHVIQPWSDAYDLGPHDEHLQHHVSFCRQYLHGHPVAPSGPAWWRFDNGPYDYPHSGYAWATKRSVLDWIGGLFELGGMGSGDHHMALAFAGQVHKSVPAKVSPSYMAHLLRWMARADLAVNRRIGFTHGTIEHRFHGPKHARGYLSRWDMFMRHDFDPDADLKRNTHGVIEWSGNKPDLEREFDLYLRSRREDDNTVGPIAEPRHHVTLTGSLIK
jgi:hypothetical protein